MIRGLIIIVLFLCCGLAQSQTAGISVTVSSSKYIGVQAKMPDSLQVNTTTDPRFLKTGFTTSAQYPDQTVTTIPNGAGKNKYAGVKVLPAPNQTTEEEKKTGKQKTDPAKKE